MVLACRSLEKAEAARTQLAARVGADPFETLAIDVSSIASARVAAAELVKRGTSIDSLLLNAGLVSGDEMMRSPDGLELTFAASLVGHHVLTLRLLDAGLLPEGARVVIAGSEAANADLPAMFDMKVYDFAIGAPKEFGGELREAMQAFIRRDGAQPFNATRTYATTKVFTSWWTAAMARRYLDVLHEAGLETVNGKTYTSRPGKMVGPMQEMRHPHLLDHERQEAAWKLLGELTGTSVRASEPEAMAG